MLVESEVCMIMSSVGRHWGPGRNSNTSNQEAKITLILKGKQNMWVSRGCTKGAYGLLHWQLNLTRPGSTSVHAINKSSCSPELSTLISDKFAPTSIYRTCFCAMPPNSSAQAILIPWNSSVITHVYFPLQNNWEGIYLTLCIENMCVVEFWRCKAVDWSLTVCVLFPWPFLALCKPTHFSRLRLATLSLVDACSCGSPMLQYTCYCRKQPKMMNRFEENRNKFLRRLCC